MGITSAAREKWLTCPTRLSMMSTKTFATTRPTRTGSCAATRRTARRSSCAVRAAAVWPRWESCLRTTSPCTATCVSRWATRRASAKMSVHKASFKDVVREFAIEMHYDDKDDVDAAEIRARVIAAGGANYSQAY